MARRNDFLGAVVALGAVLIGGPAVLSTGLFLGSASLNDVARRNDFLGAVVALGAVLIGGPAVLSTGLFLGSASHDGVSRLDHLLLLALLPGAAPLTLVAVGQAGLGTGRRGTLNLDIAAVAFAGFLVQDNLLGDLDVALVTVGVGHVAVRLTGGGGQRELSVLVVLRVNHLGDGFLHGLAAGRTNALLLAFSQTGRLGIHGPLGNAVAQGVDHFALLGDSAAPGTLGAVSPAGGGTGGGFALVLAQLVVVNGVGIGRIHHRTGGFGTILILTVIVDVARGGTGGLRLGGVAVLAVVVGHQVQRGFLGLVAADTLVDHHTSGGTGGLRTGDLHGEVMIQGAYRGFHAVSTAIGTDRHGQAGRGAGRRNVLLLINHDVVLQLVNGLLGHSDLMTHGALLALRLTGSQTGRRLGLQGHLGMTGGLDGLGVGIGTAGGLTGVGDSTVHRTGLGHVFAVVIQLDVSVGRGLVGVVASGLGLIVLIDILALFHLTDLVGVAARDTGGFHHVLRAVGMLRRGNEVAILLAAAALTGIGGVALLVTGGIGVHAGVIVMAGGRDGLGVGLALRAVSTDGTGVGHRAGRSAVNRIGSAGPGPCPLARSILDGIDRLRHRIGMGSLHGIAVDIGAAGTGAAGVAVSGTGGGHGRHRVIVMVAIAGHGGVADGTVRIHTGVGQAGGVQTGARLDGATGRTGTVEAVLGGVGLVTGNIVVVAEGIGQFVLGVAAAADVGLTAARGAGGLDFVHAVVVGFATLLKIAGQEPLAVYIFEGMGLVSKHIGILLQVIAAVEVDRIAVDAQVAAVSILQVGRGDGDFHIGNVRIVLGGLIRLGVATRADRHFAGARADDVRLVVGGIHKRLRGALAKDDLTVNLHAGVIGTVSHRIGRAGGIAQVVIPCICLLIAAITAPIIVVIDVHVDARAHHTGSTFADDDLRAGMQGKALADANRTFLHVQGHVTVDGQLVHGGRNRLAAHDAQRDSHGNDVHLDVAIQFDPQTTGGLLIVLDDIAALHIEHAAGGADELQRLRLDAHQRDRNGHAAIFAGAVIQAQRHLNVLDIVLAEDEHALTVVDHAGSSTAAAPVSHLEVFVHGGAVLGMHRAGAGNIAPGIQESAALQGDGAVGGHLDLAVLTGHAARRVAAREMGAANAHTAMDRQVGAAGHVQRTVGRGGTISETIGITVVDVGLGGQHLIRTAMGDQQGLARRNGIITRRQRCVSHHHNGGTRRIGFVQVIIDLGAVNQEIRRRRTIGIGKGCHDCGFLHLRLIAGESRRRGFQLVGIGVIPADELHTGHGRSDPRSSVGGADFRRVAGRHSRTANRHGAHRVVINKRHIRAGKGFNAGEVGHDKLVGRAVLSRRDGDGKAGTRFKALGVCAAGAAVHHAVNLQLINARSRPIKGDIRGRGTGILHGDRRSLGRCKGSKDTGAALGGGRHSAIGVAGVSCTGNADLHAVHHIPGTGGRTHLSHVSPLFQDQAAELRGGLGFIQRAALVLGKADVARVILQILQIQIDIVDLLQAQAIHEGLDLGLGGGGSAQVGLHQLGHLILHEIVRLGELGGHGGRGGLQLLHRLAHLRDHAAQGVRVILGGDGHAGAGGGGGLEGQLLLLGHHGGGGLGRGGGSGSRGAFGGLGDLGRLGGHGGRATVVQAHQQPGVAKANHLGQGIGLADDSAIHITLDDRHIAAGDALHDGHAAAAEEGNVARLRGIIAAGGHVGALGRHAVDPAAVAGAGEEGVIGDIGILRHEGQERVVPAAVGGAVPGAVAGIALLGVALEDEVLLALGVAHLGLRHAQQAAAPAGGQGGAADGRSPILLGLLVMLRHSQGAGNQLLGVQGIVNNDDQLIVAVALGGEGQLGGSLAGGDRVGGHHLAVLHGLQRHLIGRHAAGELRRYGDSAVTHVHMVRGCACADGKVCNLQYRDSLVVAVIMLFLRDDRYRAHREQHDQHQHHRQTTMTELDVHVSSSLRFGLPFI